MRIGVFDSGLGGLAIAQSLMRRLPDYDYLYLGDTKRVPYGNRSQETIHEFVSQALDYMFGMDCQIVILACNTASSEALRKSQREYLPRFYPDRRVLGVIIPTSESVFEGRLVAKAGLLATESTVASGAYERELARIQPSCRLVATPAPLLVPLVENDGFRYVEPILDDYLSDILAAGCECLILGCTHYCLIKQQARRLFHGRVLSQDELLPGKLAEYLVRHPEIERRLGRHGERLYHATDLTEGYCRLAHRLAETEVRLQRVTL